MTATVVNIVLEQGATFSMNVALNDANNNPLDVTDYTSMAQLRRDYQSMNVHSFDTALSNGQLQFSMTANNAAQIAAGRYVYDVVMIRTDGFVARVQEGLCTIPPEVTNWSNTAFPVTSP